MVPLRKLPQPLSQWNLRREAKVALQRSGVGVCSRHIPGLHRYKLLVGFEIVVFRKHVCTNKFLLQDVDKIEQVLGLASADVVDLVRRYGQTVLPGLALRSLGHHSGDAFHNVIHIGEVAAAVAEVIDLNGLTYQELVGKTKISHIGASRRTIYREKP